MSNTIVETIPPTWNDERDGVFFHLTAQIFTPEFCTGAGVLLASYDEELVHETPAPEPTTPSYRSVRTGLSPQH